MNKLLSTTIVVLTLTFSGAALANSEWYGKEGQDEKATYMNAALSKLPADKAEEFRNTMQDADENNKPLQEQIYKLHGELHAILTAPTFDKDAFLAKRSKVQQVHSQMESNKTDAFASAISDLSQKERVILTRSLHHAHVTHNKQHTAQLQNDNPSTAVSESTSSIKH